MRRRAVLLGVLALAASATTVAGAAEGPVATDATPVVEAPDFASLVYGDAWDFENPADADAMMTVFDAAQQGGPRRFGFGELDSGGSYRFVPDDATQWFLIRSWGREALPMSRDGGNVPVDAQAFHTLSFEATWTGTQDRPAGVFFATCVDDADLSCQGGKAFTLKKGTHRYRIDLRGPSSYGASAPAQWGSGGGEVAKLLVTVIGPSTPAGEVAVPWVRLHGGSAGAADGLPPGTWVGTDGVTYDVAARPLPVVSDPDVLGGQDYASTVRGDAWDMSQLSDLSFWYNAAVSHAGSRVDGVNAAPQPNDNLVLLSQGGPRINARRWHRLSLDVGYGGAFELTDAPGGGMNARWIWDNEAVSPWPTQESAAIVVIPGAQRLTVDLHTDPPGALNDDDISPRLGWGGPGSPWVTKVRWDPNEDPGGRTWWIDHVRLARNDIADPSFSITFRDGAWAPGTTADLYLVDGPGQGGGHKLNAAPVAVAAGTNTYALDARTLPEQGLFWVRLELTRDGTTSTAWSSGPVETSTPVEFVDVVPGGNPFFDDVSWLVKEKIANGNSPDVYGAGDPVSRQAMAAFLHRLVHDAAAPGPCASAPFPDVPTTHPFCGHITWLAGAGITTGNADGRFGATAPVSRQAMSAFLYRLAHDGADAPPCAAPPFSDVPTTNPFCGAIAWMSASGITTGTGNGTFTPGAPVSRQAMAAFLRRYVDRP